MPMFKGRAIALTALAVFACSGTSRAADGIVDLSWYRCAPVIENISTTVPGTYSLYVSVLGIDIPHRGYEIAFMYGNIAQTFPDAWGFEANECAGSSLIAINHLASPGDSAACPSFQGPGASIQVKNVSFVPPVDPSGFPLTNLRVSLMNSYPQVNVVDRGRRYFLERVVFDHTYSVVGPTHIGYNCGGFEQSMCFKLARARYLDPNQIKIEFGRHGGPTATPVVSFNSMSACTGPTPANPATWGQIKNQYR